MTLFIYVYVCLYAWLCLYVCICMSVSVCVTVYMSISLCICDCMSVCVLWPCLYVFVCVSCLTVYIYLSLCMKGVGEDLESMVAWCWHSADPRSLVTLNSWNIYTDVAVNLGTWIKDTKPHLGTHGKSGQEVWTKGRLRDWELAEKPLTRSCNLCPGPLLTWEM